MPASEADTSSCTFTALVQLLALLLLWSSFVLVVRPLKILMVRNYWKMEQQCGAFVHICSWIGFGVWSTSDVAPAVAWGHLECA